MPVVLSSPTPFAAQLARAGLRHANTLLTRLVHRHPAYLSYPINVGAFSAWMLADHPDFAKALIDSGSANHFERRLGRYLCLAGNHAKILDALRRTSPYAERLDWSPSAPSAEHLDRAIALVFPGWSNETRSDALGDATLLLGALDRCKQAPKGGGSAVGRTIRHRVAALSPALERARQEAESTPDTCFILSSRDLPEDMRRQVSERYCLVVPLSATFDESWILHSRDEEFSFDQLVLTDSASFNDLRTMLTTQEGVMFDYEALQEHVFRRFRAELPVVYASESSCVLVSHPLQPFSLETLFFCARTQFEYSWDCGSCESFERQIQRLCRDGLPRHVYVNRAVRDLSDECSEPAYWPTLRHWTLEP